MFISHLLTSLIIIPLAGCLHLLCFNYNSNDSIKSVGLWYSFFTLIFSCFLWIFFDNCTSDFQFVESYHWLDDFNIHFVFGIDGISLFFIILTTLLIPLCLLASWTGIQKRVKEYIIAFLIIESILIAVFSILDVLLFYVFFESVLIPMFLIIGFWGSRESKIRAAYLFFIYTLFGSVLILLAILYLYSTFWCFNSRWLKNRRSFPNFFPLYGDEITCSFSLLSM